MTYLSVTFLFLDDFLLSAVLTLLDVSSASMISDIVALEFSSSSDTDFGSGDGGGGFVAFFSENEIIVVNIIIKNKQDSIIIIKMIIHNKAHNMNDCIVCTYFLKLKISFLKDIKMLYVIHRMANTEML